MPTYETLPANNTPEFRELARQLGDALGDVGDQQTGAFTGAADRNAAYALLAQYSPADRLRLTRGTMRINGGESGREMAFLPDGNIMLFLANKFSRSPSGATRSYEGLEQSLQLFADMPVNQQTTANLNMIFIEMIAYQGGENNFLVDTDAARARRAIFFNGTGIGEDDAGNPYQRLRLIGIRPGQRPVVQTNTSLLFIEEQEPTVISGLPGMVHELATAELNSRRRNAVAIVGGINVGGSSASFTSISVGQTQVGNGNGNPGSLVLINGNTPVASPTVITL